MANELYAENRITFIPELIIQGGKRPDFGFFLNGLPIVTMELKHEKTQNVHDAVAQYTARDHSDRIFQLPFLHIAADTCDVQVATDPRAESNFRWFNTGLANHPQTDGEYPVEFLYREVLSKESLLEAISFYLVRAAKQEAGPDRPERPAFTLFPRYHQRRCVDRTCTEVVDHFVEHGNLGLKLLENHSAGSCKTLTMCWMADRLNSLYKPGTHEKIVDIVFLITDRKSLDKNIREDMEKFSHLADKVRYAKRSGDLRRFIENREQIIVTTQQKFHYILKKISRDKGLQKLRVAFLIDEAHRSQEGRMARERSLPFRVEAAFPACDPIQMVAEEPEIGSPGQDEEDAVEVTTAAAHAPGEPDAEDAQDQQDPQDMIARVIAEHDLNQLFIAFTATPSPATIQLFGEPFDTYSEAEAIQEGYILDVAQSIISYKVLYAFSDFVHPKTNKTITERDVNGLNDGELIEDRFEEDSYRLMIVASKFQTGFDQPLLAGMFLDKAVADRNAVQTISRLNRCHPDKEGVVVVDFTNNAKAILKAFNKYRHGSPHEPDEPDAQKCIELCDEIIAKGVFTQTDAGAVVELIKKNKGGTLETRVNELRIHFNTVMTDAEERKAFVYLLAKFVKTFHFLSAFFSYEKPITGFAAFCEYVGPQLIKAGSVSDLMKQIRATVVEKAAVTDQGTVNMPAGQTKPKPGRGGGGGGEAPVKRISVQDMIAKIREEFQITEEEALHIREVSEEKIADESVQQTVAAHRADLGFLNTVYRDQINGGIQDAYTLRQLYEQLADPKYTDKTGIFDIMALTVIQKGLELAEAS